MRGTSDDPVFVTSEIHKRPWKSRQEPHTCAIDSRKNLQKTRKRPSSIDVGFHGWVTYTFRFILTGGLRGDWDTFGGLAAQLTHLGAVANRATAENAAVAHVYDSQIRPYADDLSKFRQRG